MTPVELEAYDAMIADRDRWKKKFEDLDKELNAELRDTSGTIWDHARYLQERLDHHEAGREPAPGTLGIEEGGTLLKPCASNGTTSKTLPGIGGGRRRKRRTTSRKSTTSSSLYNLP